ALHANMYPIRGSEHSHFPSVEPHEEFGAVERRLTSAPRNSHLARFGPWSPDSRWLAYDTRTAESEMGSNPNIEMVNVDTGRIVTLYETPNQTPFGPGCGTVSFHPRQNRVLFIHGLLNADEQRPYDFHRRMAMILDLNRPDRPILPDARDVTPPFTPGALRGGTHAHEWAGDGNWIGFTYNDAILHDLQIAAAAPHDLRTVGVAKAGQAVHVDDDPRGENHSGQWFSVLVATVTPEPQPGSDQVSRAFSNAWVGQHGYRKADGTMQRAQAWLGHIRTADGQTLTELFISDIPDDITRPGSDGPLAGTASTLPAPPAGCSQRRLTHLENRKHPGVATQPRHWVASSPDGEHIAFLAHDDNGIVQVYAVSPRGGPARQASDSPFSVQSPFAWRPDGKTFCYAADNSIFLCAFDPQRPSTPRRLTPRSHSTPLNPTWSPDGRSIAFNRLVTNANTSYRQVFVVTLTADEH
ncbi:MAG: DUF3748 domain-containing protein, partial [Sedimentisphaerales bacterium]|nr:DUF3748 domain-containing protein [Sedimentisphaerales bacterium]